MPDEQQEQTDTQVGQEAPPTTEPAEDQEQATTEQVETPPADDQPVVQAQRGTTLDDVTTLQKALDKAREEAADNRVGRRQADAKVDDLAKQLHQARVSLALTRAGTKAGADLDLLEPYLRGRGVLDSITADEDQAISEAVEKMVQEALEASPKLANGTPPPPNSAEAPGGDKGGLRTFTRAEIAEKSKDRGWLQDNLADIRRWQAAGSPGIDG